MQKRRFIINSFILTFTSIIARIIGILFRIYMSNKIGAEAIGLYQLISTAYFFVVTFCVSGLGVAVTRMVTDAIAKRDYSIAKKITLICLIITLSLSIVFGTILFSFADFIGIVFLKDIRTALPLKILSFSLPFLAVSSTFRGYFYAIRKVIYTAGEQLLEQVVEISVFVIIITGFAGQGIEYACCAIVIGTTCAEIISCIYSVIIYYISSRKYKIKKGGDNCFKKITEIAVPITLSSCVRSGLNLAENSLIPQGLKKFGSSGNDSLSEYGILIGMVSPVIAFPAVFLSSVSLLLIPEMSEANAVNSRKSISNMSYRVFQITLVFSIMICGMFFFFSDQLGNLIYHNSIVGFYIKVLAPLIPLIYLDSIVDGILKGLNQQMYNLLYNIIDALIRVILIYFLLPIHGIKGIIFVLFFSAILNFTLSISRLVKVTEVNFNVVDWIIKPSFAIYVSCMAVNLVLKNFLYGIYGNVVEIIAIFFLVALLYFALMFLIKAIKKEDLKWVKKCFIRL